MTFKEIEKLILSDGWEHVSTVGSHHHYKHPAKIGKVTINFCRGDLKKGTESSILRQAGLK